MSVWTVILIIAVIAAIILGVLYFVGRKMQAKQEDQRAQLDQMAQTVNMLVIDKKRMKIMEAGFPKMITFRNVLRCLRYQLLKQRLDQRSLHYCVMRQSSMTFL